MSPGHDRVSEWMSAPVHTVRPEGRLIDAFELMRDYQIRHVPVVEADRVVGIVSDRDVRSALPSLRELEGGSARYGRILMNTRIAEIMTSMPFTIGLHATIADAAAVICRERIGALPVVDQEHLVGIISAEDVLLAFLESTRQPNARPVDAA